MKALIVTGRLSPKTGGPLATIGNIAKVFVSQGYDSRVLALGPSDGFEIPIPGYPDREIHGRYRSYVRKLYTEMSSADVVVIVGVWHPVFAFATLIASLKSRLKLILVPTNSLMPWDWKKHRSVKALLRPVLWLMARRFDALVCASSGELQQSWPAAAFRRGIAIPHAVRIPEIPGESFDRRSVVTYAGRLEPQKDIDLLVATASKLRPGLALEICGDGEADYVGRMKEKAETLAANIIWVGWLSRNDVLSRMKSSSAVVVTSLAENFCHTAAEAASVGTPVVIVDRIASASDLVSSPLIEAVPATPEALAESLNARAASQPSESSIVEARAWAVQEWSAESYTRRWGSLLKTVIGTDARADAPSGRTIQ